VTDPLALIDQACSLALRFRLRPSLTPTDCLEAGDGYYCFSDQAREFHPLQAALVAEPLRSPDWQADVATRLGVPATWVEGFLDGFAQTGETSADPEYVQGYLAAEELRARRFRRFLG
jgi:hypothetical protein